MRTADNDNIATTDGASVSGSDIEDAGLSSAMHDMRLLAKRYIDHRESGRKSSSIALQSTAVDPRVLLLPTMEPQLDRWKLALLSLMVIIGLSTSAIAVGLVMRAAPETKKQSYHAPEPVPAILPAPELTIDASPATSIPEAESTVYEVVASPETARSTPERHELVVPPVTRTKRSKPRLGARTGGTSAAVSDAPKQCDEVACFLGESDACCGKDPGEQADTIDEETRAERPYRLSRQQVMKPMKSITGRVRSCADQNDFQGIATATIVIAPAGSVQEVAVDEGSASFRACVESKVKTLNFPTLQQSFTTKYPFILR